MCIIIAKKKEDRLPTNEELKNCFTRNKDGAGFMYVDGGYVHIDKGYMNYDAFIKRYNDLCKKYKNFKDKALVIHCRIGTSSGNTPENTHPYPITNNEKYLHALNVKCSLGMAHNGIIPGYTPTWTNPTTNDTQEFVMKFVYELRKRWSDFYKNDRMLKALDKITNSRLAFLDNEENLYLVGDWVTENGLKFSNGTFRTYTYTYGTYSCATNHYKSKYEDSYEDAVDTIKETKSEKATREYKEFLQKSPSTSGDLPMSPGKTLYEIDTDDFVSLKGGSDLIYVSSQIGWRKVGLLDSLVYDFNSGDVYRYYSYNKCYKLIYTNTFAYTKDLELYDDACITMLDKTDLKDGALA